MTESGITQRRRFCSMSNGSGTRPITHRSEVVSPRVHDSRERSDQAGMMMAYRFASIPDRPEGNHFSIGLVRRLCCASNGSGPTFLQRLKFT
jgi:hypothetical protein